MKILNLGSLNLDKVYSVAGFVRPGQTIMASDYEVFCGGKGLNQTVALARAGVPVCHAGMTGPDGGILRKLLEDCGADTRFLWHVECDSGHAVIQVEPSGQNCIIVYGGANRQIAEKHIDEALAALSAGDMLLTQNETSGVAYAIEAAHRKGVRIVFNPSPITPELHSYPLGLVDIFILNEIEGAELSGCSGSYEEILKALEDRFPDAVFVLTVGKDGAYYKNGREVLYQPAFKVKVIDTTAAGDTFCGYFLASLAKGFSPREALLIAARAAAEAVGRSGAAPSIPMWREISDDNRI
jgi:ribokinase